MLSRPATPARATVARRIRPLASALGLLALTLPSAIQGQSPPVLTWGAEIRPRSEIRRPVDGRWDGKTSMRARLSLDAVMEPSLRLFVQVQDVRDWGEEQSERDRSADAMDFHQAYLEVDRVPGVDGLLRLGRQEVGLGEQRLIGAPNWGQAGQTFDGVRWIRPVREDRLEVVYLTIQEASSPAHDADADLVAGSYALSLGAAGSADIVGVHNRLTGPEPTHQTTFGGIWSRTSEAFSARVEGLAQLGERGGRQVRAFFLAGRAGVAALEDRASVTLWYDYLSGDGNPADDDLSAFSTLYGARNRFYGRADYFTNIPVDTEGLGLTDAALKFAFRLPALSSLNLDLHAFHTARRGDLSSRRLGEELDTWFQCRFRRALALQAGYSLTWAGPGMEELGLLEGTGHFGYLMTSLQF